MPYASECSSAYASYLLGCLSCFCRELSQLCVCLSVSNSVSVMGSNYVALASLELTV